MEYNIELSSEFSERVFEKIKKKYLFEKEPSINPIGIILGGQPGSGKSFLVNEVRKEFQKDFIFISTDDLRLYHPAYATLQQNSETLQNAANLVNPYASAWTERLIKYCIENKFNIIIDSTLGGNVIAVYHTIDMLRENNFSFHLRLMAVPALISKLSIFLRYEFQLKEKGFARWTRMEDHDDRFEKIPQVLEQIFTSKPPDAARFYQRVLATNITTSLKSSQVFFLDNNTFPTFAFLQDFQLNRNLLNRNDTGFIVDSIRNIEVFILQRGGTLDEFRTMILQESDKITGRLKRMILKTITNI
ncbi:zeta toxin family protein [Emticicia oligotrophica]|uniref:zeta toxin family protein n=1 Tax=Emticicia oligotrophica TaxID=312279 RepID=UPI00273C89A0|nr:zeta toxin family protein [Emticicia oligotrophica]